MFTDKEYEESASCDDAPMSDTSNESGHENAPEVKSRLSRYASYLKPARQLPLAWTSALLTVVFLVLTAVYSSQPTVASHMRLLYTSSSNTIFVLSLLSSLTGLFLGATINAAFERLRWLLVVRRSGLQLTKFLGLQAGTGITGLFVLTAGGGQPMLATARLWSAVRLVSTVLVPLLSILIMSQSFPFVSSR